MTAMPLRLLKGTFDILILRTLSWGPAHGYAISRWIRETSGEDLRIEEGALYPALRRLEERGLVESSWETTDTGRDAKVYRLTESGTAAMRAEVAEWKRYVAAFSRVLAARPTGGIA
jgi:PadR family transcriptional regulator, regulatory protein PadR